MLTLALLAGGLATRMGVLTRDRPKSMLDVAGRPFIEHQLDYMRAQGITNVVLCIGHLGEQIQERVGDGQSFRIKLRYAWDGDRLLGTGGALNQAKPLLSDPFFVQYGDSFLPIDYAAVARAHERSGQPALMTILANDNQYDRSNVEFRDGSLLAYSKRSTRAGMRHIDYGLSVLSHSVFAGRPAGVNFDLADLFEMLSGQGRLAGLEVHRRFYEIGSPDGLDQTIQHFQSRTNR